MYEKKSRTVLGGLSGGVGLLYSSGMSHHCPLWWISVGIPCFGGLLSRAQEVGLMRPPKIGYFVLCTG